MGSMKGSHVSPVAVAVIHSQPQAGAEAEGGHFRPHVTLARIRRPLDVTKWVRVLEAYRGPTWEASRISLVASHLGEGPRKRPRYEVIESFPLRQAAS